MIRRVLACRLLTLAVASTGLGLAAQAPARGPVPPRLVVLLVIDQFSAEYPDLYGKEWTHGLARLFADGAVFPIAAYPYADTVTCPGHFTIGTGALPRTHGMVGDDWYDPATKRLPECTTDPDATSVPFGGGPGVEHHSGHNVMSASFADELRRQSARLPKVLSISLKARSAIGMVGRGGPGTMVIWNEANGTWATSSAYTKTAWPDVDEYVRAHPVAAAYGQTWTRLLPASSYLFEDDGLAENSPGSWTRTFPHELKSPSGQPDRPFFALWDRSPWIDAYIGDMANALAAKLQLGQESGTDVLALGFSALDEVGHDYGPHSHEVQDIMARLDVVIGSLLDALDISIGAGRYVVALSSDHGVAPIPEQAARLGIDAGRLRSGDVHQAAQTALTKLLGEGTFYAGFSEMSLYLTPGTVDLLRARAGAIDELKNALAAVSGVARVYGPDEISQSAPTDDPILRAIRLGYFPSRTGDFVVVPKPYWPNAIAGTTHGTPYDYDQHVPMLFYGAGIKPGRYSSAATPADIAPTLAALCGIKLPQADGHALKEALK
jgi:predicted AlkP superfamily pyrophosphatase or phosphodiesterase